MIIHAIPSDPHHIAVMMACMCIAIVTGIVTAYADKKGIKI